MLCKKAIYISGKKNDGKLDADRRFFVSQSVDRIVMKFFPLHAGNCHASGACHIDNADIADHIHKVVDLRRSAGDFHTKSGRSDSNKFTVEDLHQLNKLGLLFRRIGSNGKESKVLQGWLCKERYKLKT